MSVSYTSYEFVNRNTKPVISPKITENNKETRTAANCSPPCLIGSELKEGVLLLRPAQNIELKIPPRIAIIILSIG